MSTPACMNRTHTSLITVTLLTGIPLCNEAATTPYNVLCIVADDLRPELGCYGDKQVHTPNIDRIASEGLVFKNAYAQQAVCTPSRASFLTGCRPDTTGLHFYYTEPFFDEFLPKHVTFQRHFMRNGYYSLQYGKIFHGGGENLSERFRFPRKPLWVLPQNQKNDTKPPIEISDLPDEEYMDGDTTQQLIADLKKAKNTGRPFCFSIGYYKPHVPLVMPKKYWDLYRTEDIQLPQNRRYPENIAPYTIPGTFQKNEDGEYTLQGGIWLWNGKYSLPDDGRPISDRYARELLHAYYACTSFIDAQIGKIMTALEELDMADNTIILLWSDHGIHYGEHCWWDKFTTFDTDTRIPMILRVPGQKSAGQNTSAFVESVDIFPTLCALCRLPSPGYLEGTSFAPLIDNPEKEWKTAAFSQFTRYGKDYGLGKENFLRGYSIRTKKWRYTEWWELGKGDVIGQGNLISQELYSHDQDSEETVNIASLPENIEIITRLSERLRKGYTGEVPPGASAVVSNSPGRWGENVYQNKEWLQGEFRSIPEKAEAVRSQ